MTRIETGHTWETTALEVVDGIDLHGTRAVVTGGASGIGVETARALASAGAEVTLAVRDTGAGERVAADITSGTGNPAVAVQPLDLADRASVAAFVKGWTGPLHLLVNNAGMMASPLMRSAEGWELQFATNHLGHFNLATGLHGALAAARGARVVSVSSSAHQNSDVHLEDLMFERRDYEPWAAYGQSKTANVLFAVEATRRWAGDGIVVNALHPGSIRSNLQRYVDEEAIERLRAAREAATGVAIPWKSTEQGAATSLVCAVSPLLEGIGGRYFEDCNEALPRDPARLGGVEAYALDPASAERLWEASEQLLGAA